jgi:hypothetical protein
MGSDFSYLGRYRLRGAASATTHTRARRLLVDAGGVALARLD